MSFVFLLLSTVTLVGAVAAISLRNLVHCALALTVTFAGLAALYLQLSAQFAGFAQILVYIGAVAILIVFAILLTRGAEPSGQIFSTSWLWGAMVALAVFSILSGMILSSKALVRPLSPAPTMTVRQIGDQLMTKYILPLEVLGLLLTAALIGAVIIAMREKTGVEIGHVPSSAKTTRNGEVEQGGSHRGEPTELHPIAERQAREVRS
ncbi:MAG TPA: NADH-quinone oxidoreductase subunit J [Candidatus Limnocylindrales bacterium]|nr:NADH-quinone oxidoreductase subunit J [Candidatus Limnocylindrales bacterium]